MVERAFHAARSFFDLPLADRLGVAMPEAGYPDGYNPFSAEALERSTGGPGVADLTDPDERAVYAPNLWPDDGLPEFWPALEAYHRAMSELSARIMEVFAVALGLAVDHSEPFIALHRDTT